MPSLPTSYSKLLIATLLSAAAATVSLDSSALERLMPLTAVPRGGDAACFADDGASLKNVCATTQLVSFMTTIDAGGQEVWAVVGSRDASNSFVCQAVSMSADQTSWAVGPRVSFDTNNHWLDLRGANSVFVAADHTYSIDCWVPAAYHLGTAEAFRSSEF